MEVIIVEKEYQRAFKEVIEVLNAIPQEDYDKIPKDVIEALENYQDKTYDFTLDINKDFRNQNISDMAKAILSNFYRDYWVSGAIKQEIINLENMQRNRLEDEKSKKYNSKDSLKVNQVEDENQRYYKALAEVDEILKNVTKEIIIDIPEGLLKVIHDNKDVNHSFKFDETKTIDEQEIMPETKAILTIIYRDFLCTEEEKKEINEILTKNDKKSVIRDENKNEGNETLLENKEQTEIVEYKDINFMKKLIEKIKKGIKK